MRDEDLFPVSFREFVLDAIKSAGFEFYSFMLSQRAAPEIRVLFNGKNSERYSIIVLNIEEKYTTEEVVDLLTDRYNKDLLSRL